MHRAVEELRTAEILGRVLKAGDHAPEFTLPNATSAPVDSRRLLTAGPLVVTFYRGRW
jgi:peroxiredoxin